MGSINKEVPMIDLNPNVEEYASGEDYWCEHSNGKSFVGFFVRVLQSTVYKDLITYFPLNHL